MMRVEELSMEMYMDCVIAYGVLEPEDFQAWCEDAGIDYADAMEYDWD